MHGKEYQTCGLYRSRTSEAAETSFLGHIRCKFKILVEWEQHWQKGLIGFRPNSRFVAVSSLC